MAANLQGRSESDVIPDIDKAMKGIDMPASVTWKYSGMQAYAQTAYSSLIFALLLGLIFVYMVLASQFRSFIHPLSVMSALPFAIIGSVAALLVCRVDLTLISAIGIIMALGLANKNSILLVDFIIRYREAGHEPDPGHIGSRTCSFTSNFDDQCGNYSGHDPHRCGMGIIRTFRAPMAITVIGGVIVATILSLVAVPVAYAIIDDVVTAISRFFHRGSPVIVPLASEQSLANTGDASVREDKDRRSK